MLVVQLVSNNLSGRRKHGRQCIDLEAFAVYLRFFALSPSACLWQRLPQSIQRLVVRLIIWDFLWPWRKT